MFGLMDFSPLAYPWSLGQRDVGSTSVHSSSSCLWNEMVSFPLFQTSSLPYSLVYIWLHFHGDLLLLISLSTVLLSLFYTMKSDFSKDMSALTDAVFLPCTHSTPVCLHQSALSLHSNSLLQGHRRLPYAKFRGQFSISQSWSALLSAPSSLKRCLP